MIKNFMTMLVFVLAITFTGCSDDNVKEDIDLSSIERVDPSVVAARIDAKIASGDYSKATIKSLLEIRDNLFSSNVSRGGNSEIICDNGDGWIVIDNNTGAMTLHEFDNSPTGVSSSSCSMGCMEDHCFDEME